MRRLIINLVFLLSACTAGSGEGLDSSGRPIGETPEPGDQPTLSNIQARIFTPICVKCHVGASARQGLRLDATNSFNDLVGVPSREVSGLSRVEPFDPDASYLFQKISGSAAVGERMPLGEPPLPDDDIELVRQWISDGAMPTTTTSQPSVSKVFSANASEVGGVQVVRISISNEIDSSSILPTSVRIIKSEDARFGNSDDKEFYDFSVAPARGTAYTLVIRIRNSTTQSGYFKLSLGSSSLTNVLDLSGRAVEAYTMQFHVESEQ